MDLPPFKVDDLTQLISDLCSKYQASMSEEIHMMTNIEDPAHTIRNADVCKKKELDLKKKFMVNEVFVSINTKVLEVAI